MEVKIDTMVYGGAGSGHAADGSSVTPAILVPFSLPGELLEVAAIEAARPVANAELIAVLEASPNRVPPPCPHFGPCGGCQYQHATYSAETDIKLQILHDTFTSVGLTGLPSPKLHTAAPWGYRNRIRLRVGTVDGELRVGYNRRGSYEMLPIRECPISAPLLMRAATAILAIVSEQPLWTRQLVEVELFTNGDQSRLQITFFLRSERGTVLANLCESLKPLLPELAGAGVIVVGDSGRKEQPGAHWGADGLQYRAAGREYWVSRGGFFQINRFLVDELVHLVTAERSGKLAWDLYAGVGLFSRALAETFTDVIGVETLVGDLSRVLKGSGMQAVGATTAEFLRNTVLQRERPDLVIMDPPRAGIGLDVCELLGRIKAREMVYVSCDPVTLARDLRAMVDSGYTVTETHLIDLFPQTFHMETVVVLNR